MIDTPRASAPAERRRDPPLPRYGRLYFNQLYAEYQLLPDKDSIQPEAAKAISEVIAKKNSGIRLGWQDLYLFDLALTRSFSRPRLAQKVVSLRTRFGDIAGPRQFAQYLATSPPDPEVADDLAIRADLDHLLSEIYFRYAIRPLREQERGKVSIRIAIILGVSAITIVVLGLLALCGWVSAIPMVFTVMMAGAIGGVVSMQQRYYSWDHDTDPMHDVSQLIQGWSSIVLSLTGGAVFALVLYLIFLAGLVEGSIFPSLMDKPAQAGMVNLAMGKQEPTGIQNILFGPLIMYREYAKLLVWCFVAGFAERLVPDTLSRIMVTGGERDEKAK